jgi:sec-independent protein translocase protein TatA
MGIGMRELIIILLVVLVVFGTKKLRTIGSDLGSAVRGFKKSMGEGEDEGDAAAKQLKSSATQPDAEFPESKPSSESTKNTDRAA